MISDDLLRQLMAVGHVDVLVGVPTLNNAATIGGVVRAVHDAFGTYFPRARTVLINSDGGSRDGTPAIVRDFSPSAAETLTVSHSLRTTHRITTPYHGVPGKGSALRQILAAADLTQASAVAVLDAEVSSVTPEWVASLIRPIREQQFDYVAPMYARHPLEGPLVTQLLRPLVRALYGRRLQEPLAAEFGCSQRFVAAALEEDVWEDSLARYGIDLWITGLALAGDFRCCQAPLGPHRAEAARGLGFQDTFQQVVGSGFLCVERQAAAWLPRQQSDEVPVVGSFEAVIPPPPVVDAASLTQSFCADLKDLHGVLEPILDPGTLSALQRINEANCEDVRYGDELWAATVYDFLDAHRRGVMRREHITQALIPLYLGRTGSFFLQHAGATETEVAMSLEALCQRFEQLKPSLVERWTSVSQR